MKLISEENDAVLAGLIDAPDEASRAEAIAALVKKAAPLIDSVLSRYSRVFAAREELDDLRSNVMLRLVRRLDEVPRNREAAIRRFDDFVATLAFNAANDLLRESFPVRARLKNRVRYVLARESRFDSWSHATGIVAGYSEWYDRPPGACGAPGNVPRGDLAPAIVAVLDACENPLLLDDLVDIIASAWGVAETTVTSQTETAAPSGAALFEQRNELAAVWNEIRALPAKQRAALLLNLRDPQAGSAIELFVLTGTATIDELAGALEMSAESLAQLWNDLPLDDQSIAERLGTKRQQVINLRRSARERLARRRRR